MSGRRPPPINLATKPHFEKRNPGASTPAYEPTHPIHQFGLGTPVHRTATSSSTFTAATLTSADVLDINVPIATNAPPSQFPIRQHSVQPVGFSSADLEKPIETNKWWGSIAIPGGEQGNLFAFPYTVWWTNSTLYGMNVMHTDASQRVFDTSNSPPQYYYNPVGIVSWNMGATEFDNTLKLSLDAPTQFTINVSMKPSSGNGYIKMPLVNGMAFVTGIYSALTPFLSTPGRAIISYQKYTAPSSTKYKVGVNDGTIWLIYAFPSSGNTFSLSQNGNSLVGNGQLSGYIQIAKIPIGDTTSEATYDSYSGIYVLGMSLFGSTSGWTGTYGFKFTTAGPSSNSVLHFALPHHMAAFDSATRSTATGLYLQSTTMGQMRAYTATTWTITEKLPNDVQFLPGGTELTAFSTAALSAIRSAAQADVQQDVYSQTNLNSQYFAGKALAKYAEICLVANDVLKDSSLTATCITKLKAAITVFANNQ